MIKKVKSLLLGLWTVLKHLFMPAVTLQYPEAKPVLPQRFRGKHSLENCVACGTCVKVCPANAITIKKENNRLLSFKVDYNKCIFCGNCQYYCPVKAIKHGKDFELGTHERADLIHEFVEESEDFKC